MRRVLEVLRFVVGRSEPETLTLEDATRLVRKDHDDLVWFNFEEPTDDEITRFADALGLDPFLVEDLREGSNTAGQRPKLLPYGDMFHLAARDCTIQEDHVLEREIDLVFGSGWLGSVRHRPDADVPTDPNPFPIEEVSRRIKTDCANGTTVDEGIVLWAFLDVLTDRYFAITTDVDDRIDAAEGEYLSDAGDEDTLPKNRSPEALYRIGRLLTEFRRQVVPLREATGALLRREDPAIGDAALLRMRDVYDHLQGINEVVESQRDILAGLRDVQLAIISNRMNKSMQKLAAWGAILIVATLVTGVLGMNFKDQPGLHWREGFAVVVGIMVVVALPMYFYFRRKDWL
jgi:magnesium transporter